MVYLRFTLSLRDVEELLAERGVALSNETGRRWVNHFGPMIARRLTESRVNDHRLKAVASGYVLYTPNLAVRWT